MSQVLGSGWVPDVPQQGISGSSCIGGPPPAGVPRFGDDDTAEANVPPEISTAPVRMMSTHALPVNVQMTPGTASVCTCI